MNAPIHPVIEKLFQYSRGKAAGKELIVPNDPGSGSYLQTWSEILKTGVIPDQESDLNFDITEVISSASWDPKPTKPGAPSYFLLSRYDSDRDCWVKDVPMLKQDYYDFRRFVHSVSLHLLHQGRMFSIGEDSSQLVYWLLQDLPGDPEYLTLLYDAFSVSRDLCYTDSEMELAFFTFGELYLAQRSRDWAKASEKAVQLIEDDDYARQIGGAISSTFLLGMCSKKDSSKWLKLGSELVNPLDHEETQLIINEFSK